MSAVGTLELRARHAVGSVLLVLGGVVALRLMGRVWWCREGDPLPWSFDIWTAHNSQHLVDPYTITHVLHGVGLYGLLWLLLRSVLSAADRGLLALAIEVAWEIGENTPTVIERYRETTLALNYYGDSVVNSVGDTVAFAGGYLLAATIPAWASAAGFLLVDALLVLWIRDGLLLNVLMLAYPLDSVRDWQMADRAAGGLVGLQVCRPRLQRPWPGRRIDRRDRSPKTVSARGGTSRCSATRRTPPPRPGRRSSAPCPGRRREA